MAVVTGCVWVGAAVAATPEGFDERAALIGAFIVCGLAALGPIVFLGQGAAREPIVYYPLLAFPHLAGSSLAWLGQPESGVSLVRADVTKALLLVAAGFAALWIGWFAARGRRGVSVRQSLGADDLPSRSITIALAVLGLSSAALQVYAGSFGYLREFDTGGPLGPWTEWVGVGRFGLDIAIAFAAFRAFGLEAESRTRGDLILLTALFTVQLGMGLLAGFKVYLILPPLLATVFIYAQFHGRFPVRWVFLAVVAILVASPIVEQFRNLARDPVVERGPASLVVTSVREAASDIEGSTESTFDTLTRRVRQVENVAVIVRDTPSVFPHTNGGDIRAAVETALVPRVIWPDKPVFDAGRRFPQTYLGQTTTSRSTTGPSHFGDLYRNFGLLGVPVGMALLGMLFAALGRRADSGGPPALLIIAFSVALLGRVEDSLAEGIVAYARVMAPVFLCALLLPRLRSGRASEGKPTPLEPRPALPAPSSAR